MSQTSTPIASTQSVSCPLDVEPVGSLALERFRATVKTSVGSAVPDQGDGRLTNEDFNTHARASAASNGCFFLFDFPAALIDEDADNAAAILCPDAQGHHLVFLTFNAEEQKISIVESAQAPLRLIDFAYSFARVLSYLDGVQSGRAN